jgi:regulator of replication initiation timing
VRTRRGAPAAVLLALAAAALLLLPAVASAQPSLRYAVYTPRGLAPGAPVTVSVEITTTREDKASLVFVRLFTVPVLLNEETLEDVHLLIAAEFHDSAQLVVSLLRDKVYSGAWDTYGYVVPVGFRAGTINRSITLKVPDTAKCGETLFFFIAYWVDEDSGWFSVPVGVVCEGEWRRGIYYEDYVKQLRDENALLNSQVTRLEATLRSAYYERDSLKRQLDQLQGELSRLQGENQQLRQQLDQLQGEAARLQQQLSALQGENQQLRQQLDQLQGEAARLQQQLSALQGENQQLRQQLDVVTVTALLLGAALAALAIWVLLRLLAPRRERG